MGQELQVPESFKKGPAPEFAGLNPHDDNLADGIGQSYGIIGYKGKVWSLRVRGERHNIIRPDDGTPSNYIDVIILGQAKQKSKSFFKKFDPNNEGDGPICSSIDGERPDPDVAIKQADVCALCPQNEWKTDPNTGRKGRACQDYKRLAVLILPTQTKPILGEPLLEGVFLRVPPASLNSLAIMGDTMAKQGYHFSSYITRISFDPNEAHPKMVFRPLQGLTGAEAPVILKMRNEPNVGRIIGGDIVLGAITHQQAPGTTSTGLAVQSTQAQPSRPAAPTAPPPEVSSGAGLLGAQETHQEVAQTSGSKPAPVAQPATPPPLTSGLANGTGLLDDTVSGGANTASSAASPSQGLQTAADAGEPEAADDDLDARIANLIKLN